MKIKPYSLGILLIISICFIQCEPKDQSPISFNLDGEYLHFKNKNIHLVFDNYMYCKVQFESDGTLQSMNSYTSADENAVPPNYIVLDSIEYKNFKISSHKIENIEDVEFGRGKRLTLIGSDLEIESNLVIEMFDKYPDVALSWNTYTNKSGRDLKVDKVFYNYYRLDRKLTNPSAKSYDFRYLRPTNEEWGDTWTNLGVSDTTNEEFAIPGSGSNWSGIPFLDVWGPEMGLGVFHVEGAPRFTRIVLKVEENGLVDIGFKVLPEESYGQFPSVLKNNASISTWKSAVCTHKNDFFDAGRRFGQLLNGAMKKEGRDGLPDIYPDQAYEPYWKTWGMNSLDGTKEFTIQQVKNKMDELADYGFKSVMLDDGWQDAIGTWNPNPKKFHDEQELIEFVQEAHKPQWGKNKDKSFNVYLWFDLLGVDTIQKSTEPLLVRNKDGSYYRGLDSKYNLCPSFEGTLEYIRDTLIQKTIVRWGIDGLYTDLDDQNPLPCYAKNHHHLHESESVDNNYLAFKTMLNNIMEEKPKNGWVSMCACAAVHDVYQYPYYFLNDASDPTSNKQVRWRTRWVKAFRGPTAPVGDGYVDKMNYDNKAGEPAMSVALGNVITSVRWDTDELGGADHAKRWMDIYFDEKLYNGEYLGLYDIEYHRPEGYVIKKEDGVMYYAFFDEKPFDKEVELRGLSKDLNYEVIEYDDDVNKGNVLGAHPFIRITSKSGNNRGEQVFYYVIKCMPLSEK
ncbi:hypothetical protein K8352_12915 [Flavobacteriaceae bacterium F89]|uniref:Alpha-galactosidase n=1 Tax=Cerina litoralis TaxID=2874477 RepID=A0AAE3JP14_9FLAO|nr:hypothetical protein [Cerina litoralis]MCG2461655.1 hypothetical protein [Cerina litoralis]